MPVCIVLSLQAMQSVVWLLEPLPLQVMLLHLAAAAPTGGPASSATRTINPPAYPGTTRQLPAAHQHAQPAVCGLDLKRDLGLFVTAIKLATRLACQLERSTMLNQQQQQQQLPAAGPDEEWWRKMPFLQATVADADGAGGKALRPPLLISCMAELFVPLTALLRLPAQLLPHVARATADAAPGSSDAASYAVVSSALGSAATCCTPLTGRLNRALLRSVRGVWQDVAVRQAAASEASSDVSMALNANTRHLQFAFNVAGPAAALAGAASAEAASPALGSSTMAGAWRAVAEARPLDTLALLLPFLLEQQPPLHQLELHAADDDDDGLASAPVPYKVAATVCGIIKLLLVLALAQPPCSGPLYDWLRPGPDQHLQAAAAAASTDSGGTADAARPSSSMQAAQLVRELRRWALSPGLEALGLGAEDVRLRDVTLLQSCLCAVAAGQPVEGPAAAAAAAYALQQCDDVQQVLGIISAPRLLPSASPLTPSASSQQATAASTMQPPARLKPFGRHMCWYPECPTFSGASEADLAMERCSACKQARYCGRPCQVAHWKAGHKQECAGAGGKAVQGAGTSAGATRSGNSNNVGGPDGQHRGRGSD